MRKLRVGIFGPATTPSDGGADTLLPLLVNQVPASLPAGGLEYVPVPWSTWSYRKHPLRFLWMKFVRAFGSEIPLVDLRPVCRALELDLAYFPAPTYARIDIPFVFTVWDLGHRTIPDFPEVRCASDPWTQREAMYRLMLPQAGGIVVGNRTGAAEVARHFGIEADRCVALPFPNPDFSAVEAKVPAWMPPGPFFLYPAQLWPHKNHATLLRALAALPGTGAAAAQLVFVGADKGNRTWLEGQAAALGLSGRVHFGGFVARGELKALYQHATALVFPSLLGPNNLPPQEAAVLGCPMILSDLPGHREQLGAGAIYAAPLDAAAWTQAMHRMLGDEARAALAAAARQAVAGYTLEAYAAGLGEILSKVAARRMLWGS